jgi:RimJ/RimL family protein N-acetyltransferase
VAAPHLRTDRLQINDLRPDDAAALHAYRSLEDVARFQGWIPTAVDDAGAFITRTLSTPFNQHDSWHQLAIREMATDKLIGDLGVHFVSDDGHQVEIGFTIAPAHQRKGLGSEAVRALLDHLFTVLGKHRVFASVDPRNEASMVLLKKVGMRQEAHFRESLFWKGEWVDDVVFALLGSEWQTRRI